MKVPRTRAVVLLAVLVACPGAAGHGDGAARGYTSKIISIEPALNGLSLQVLAGDDQLRLRTPPAASS